MQGLVVNTAEGMVSTDASSAVVQAEGEGILVQPEYQGLVQDLWMRQTAALERASPAATAAAAEAREAAAKGLKDLPEQPSWVSTSSCHGSLSNFHIAFHC